MINRILMELYDEYEKENIEPLKEFSNITFVNKNASIVFMGCTLIMFSKVHGLKPRYLCTREELLEIVLSIKQKINNTNLLEFYLDRINTKKGINKYFKKIILVRCYHYRKRKGSIINAHFYLKKIISYNSLYCIIYLEM